MTSLMTILEDYFNWKGKKTVVLYNSLLWSIVTVYYFNTVLDITARESMVRIRMHIARTWQKFFMHARRTKCAIET